MPRFIPLRSGIIRKVPPIYLSYEHTHLASFVLSVAVTFQFPHSRALVSSLVLVLSIVATF